MKPIIPIALFAYARPDHLGRILACLRENQVPIIYAFSDGAKNVEKQAAVDQVREIIRAVDWCEVILKEQETNLGLGKSILAGVSQVLEKHNSVIVLEDDLVFVPGTYAYLCTALEHYKDDERVMSVTGWTQTRVTPSTVVDQPYFDGRFESWSWGTWARAWRGMDQPAKVLMQACQKRGVDIYRYGADLPETAEQETKRNLWAVRFVYLHLLQGGTCMRPPWSLVEHAGFDATATNASDSKGWSNLPLRDCPPIPTNWPEPAENPECAPKWRKIFGEKPTIKARIYRGFSQLAHSAYRLIKKIGRYFFRR